MNRPKQGSSIGSKIPPTTKDIVDEVQFSSSKNEVSRKIGGGSAGIFVDHVDKPFPIASSRTVPLPKLPPLFGRAVNRNNSLGSSDHSATILKRTGSEQSEFSEDPLVEGKSESDEKEVACQYKKDNEVRNSVRRVKSAPMERLPQTTDDVNKIDSNTMKTKSWTTRRKPFVPVNPFDVYVPERSRSADILIESPPRAHAVLPAAQTKQHPFTSEAWNAIVVSPDTVDTSLSATTHSTRTVVRSNCISQALEPASISSSSPCSKFRELSPYVDVNSNRGIHCRTIHPLDSEVVSASSKPLHIEQLEVEASQSTVKSITLTSELADDTRYGSPVDPFPEPSRQHRNRGQYLKVVLGFLALAS